MVVNASSAKTPLLARFLALERLFLARRLKYVTQKYSKPVMIVRGSNTAMNIQKSWEIDILRWSTSNTKKFMPKMVWKWVRDTDYGRVESLTAMKLPGR